MKGRRVVVQDRSRLFREGLSLALNATPTLCLMEPVSTAEDLDVVCAGEVVVDSVVLEVSAVPWDVRKVVRQLSQRRIDIVGTAPARFHLHEELGIPVVRRTARLGEFVAALVRGDLVDASVGVQSETEDEGTFSTIPPDARGLTTARFRSSLS